jgi:hypothetical protein
MTTGCSNINISTSSQTLLVGIRVFILIFFVYKAIPGQLKIYKSQILTRIYYSTINHREL